MLRNTQYELGTGMNRCVMILAACYQLDETSFCHVKKETLKRSIIESMVSFANSQRAESIIKFSCIPKHIPTYLCTQIPPEYLSITFAQLNSFGIPTFTFLLKAFYIMKISSLQPISQWYVGTRAQVHIFIIQIAIFIIPTKCFTGFIYSRGCVYTGVQICIEYTQTVQF